MVMVIAPVFLVVALILMLGVKEGRGNKEDNILQIKCANEPGLEYAKSEFLYLYILASARIYRYTKFIDGINPANSISL